MKKLIVAMVVLTLTVSFASAFPKLPKKEKSKSKETTPAAKTVEKPKVEKLTPAATENLEIPTGDVDNLDGFEEGNYWVPIKDSWGDGDKSSACNVTEAYASEGSNSLKCDFKKMGDQKAGFYTDQPIDPDWTDAKYILVDIYNPNDFELKLVFVIQSGENWTWNQSDWPAYVVPQQTVSKNISVNISGFKGLEQVNRMIVYVVGECPEGSFYLDNYRIVR